VTDSTGRRFREDLLAWAEENLRDFPWRERDQTLYQVFVAEFFLTQTPASNVESVYPEFLDQYPTLDAIEETTKRELVDVIEPLGFYNMRAEALQCIAAENEHLPQTATELGELPRVVDYVANATLCFASNEPLPVVDRNVERIYRRVFRDWPDSSTEQYRFAARLVPEDEARVYNLALLDFAAAVCKPDPSCECCFAADYCEYYREQT